ncbi:unnamed protein product [Linum tenue]|uniref:non-specific serine/threonine protein kinase n=1 Tax=Linum tenue TaxID=586396 RepID=A0AAV0S1J0_9ROSI|nr:unnamed protein product [Linum tenue]
MNRFHIYEAIGRGKCSTVYKGRKKKTIEYYAIKSVDKSQKRKVLHEVKILHSLDHSNVLKFYSWYETSAHLWLVLEYCVGGDLRTLLQQDSQLPEDSVQDFALDLVTALQYLHSKGIIYCDLKPSNILLDENGLLKLCDFGLAKKLSDISKTHSSSTEAKCGTPCYMAPELFEDAGVHSYASDFWALGCVLYECYAGKPPFVGKEFTQLVKSIVSDPTPPLPGNPSRHFANLVNSLLVKDPAERIQWSDLCGHAFWKSKLPLMSLPPQPAFDCMIEFYARPCLLEHNGDRSLQNKTPTEGRERDARVTPRKDENSQSGLRVFETPVKGTPGSKRPQTKASGRAVEEKQKDNSSANSRINLLRLSRVAKTNLQRENEKENFRRPLANASENDSEIKMENTDMELDFNENTEDDTQDEPEGSDNSICTPGRVDNHVQPMDISPVTSTPALDDQGTNDLESPSETADMGGDTPVSASPQPKHQRVKEGLGSAHEFDSSKSSNNISEVLWHPSDLSVRPVMPSRKGDKTHEAPPSLPFEALQPTELLKMTKEQLHSVNAKIVSIFNGNTSVGEKQNAIRYLEMLSNNAEIANTFTNGPVMLILVKMLRLSKASTLRVQLASLIGLLIRHATFIDDDLANSGILSSLTDGLRDRQEKVRRFSMAALGELLFYIATQNDQSKDNNPSKSPAKDNNKSVPGWQVPNSLISMVSSVLRKGEDDITQLYALRTIENVCSQGGHWATRFTSQDGRDDFQITLLQVLESIVEESPLILANPQIFVGEILPSLATLYKGNKDGHVRFLCLKILFHVMVIFLNELSQDDKLSKALNSIANVHFLPLYPTLVEDEDPIPIFSQKLLVMLIDFNFIKISDILHVKTVSQCFGFLLGDLSSANVSNVKLCLAMASAPEMESKLLSQLKVVRRISNLLEFVCAKDMEDFLEPTLGLCRAFLLRSLTGEQGSAFRTQPSLLTAAGGFSSGGSVDGIRDVMDFGSNVGLWLELSCNSSTEPNVAELASECVVLLLKAAPREATTGFLTNLPKVSTILEPWRRGVPRLILLRTLHALCYACRQYLSHAMILSMSVAEVSRVQGIVMEIKGSAGGDLSDAASLVGLELQRLPRHL